MYLSYACNFHRNIIIDHRLHRWQVRSLALDSYTFRLMQCSRGLFARRRHRRCVPKVSSTAVTAPNHSTEVRYFLAISAKRFHSHRVYRRNEFDCCHYNVRSAGNFALQVFQLCPSIDFCRNAQNCRRAQFDRFAENEHDRSEQRRCPIDRSEQNHLDFVQNVRMMRNLLAFPTNRLMAATNSPGQCDSPADCCRVSVCVRRS